MRSPRSSPRIISVQFEFPGQETHRRSCPTLDEGERLAGRLARHGATARVGFIPMGREPMLVSQFGPDQEHVVTAGEPGAQSPYSCTCSRQFGDDQSAIDDHVQAAGLCRFCRGGRTVIGAEGGPVAGQTVDCPVCEGSGQATDEQYWDVTLDHYIPRR